ncbi:hypothetical protein AUP68_10364 [Ilyonectria robusta]
MTIEQSGPLQLELSATFGPEELVQLLWDFSSSNKRLFNGDLVSESCHSAYHEYYERQWGLTAAHCDGKFVALKTCGLVNDLIREMQNNNSRAELLSQIQDMSWGGGPGGESCENSLNLAVRLLLMLRIGVVEYQLIPRRCLRWDEGTLRDSVYQRFGETPIMNVDGVRLPKAFNSWSLETIGSIEISFTDNLADHLLLIEDDSKVLILHYASFLDCQRLRGSESLFPPGFAEETLQTLALLFPQSMVHGSSSPKTSMELWFRKLCNTRSTYTIDERLGRCGNLRTEDRQIKSFLFWRDRLVILKQAYDEAAPRTLSQFWHDGRNGGQWYTFWVAIIILVVTIISAVV